MASTIYHMCNRVFCMIKSDYSLVSTRGVTQEKENQGPIIQEEPSAQSLVENVKKKLTESEQIAMEAKRFQRPMGGGRSFVSSQVNLMSQSPIPEDLATDHRSDRRWAPVSFTPLSGGRRGIHSAPVTPLPPLSPVSDRVYKPSHLSPNHGELEGSLTPIGEQKTSGKLKPFRMDKSEASDNATLWTSAEFSADIRPSSAISDHPSLATGSIDMGSTATREEIDAVCMEISGYTGDEDVSLLSTSFNDSEKAPSPSYFPEEKEEHSISLPTATELSVTTSGSNQFTQSSRLSTIASVTEPLSSNLRYPSAFESNIPNFIAGDSTNAPSLATTSQAPKSDFSSGIVHQQPVQSSIMSSSYHSTSSDKNAFWSPGAKPSPSAPEPAPRTSLLSPLSPSSLIPGYRPLNFIAPGEGVHNSLKLNPPFPPVSPLVSPQPPKSAPTTPSNPAPPPVPPKKTPLTPSLVPAAPVSPNPTAIPPAPPPPAPGQTPKPPSALEKKEEPWVPTTPGEERSEIEVPEKQSVASLRSAILAKLNGAAPVQAPLAAEEDSKSVPVTPSEPPPAPQQFSAPPKAPVTAQPVSLFSPVSAPPTVSKPPFSFTSTPAVPPQKAPFAPPQPVFSQAPANPHTSAPFSPPQQLTPSKVDSYPSSLYSPVPPPTFPSISAPESAFKPAGYTPTASPLPPRPPPPEEHFGAPPSAPYGQQDYYRGGSVPMREGSPPRGSVLVQRTGSIDGSQVRTESFYAVPHKEYYPTQTRTARQSDFRYKGVGPTDERGTPMGLRQHVPSGDYQHHWYKMMYKKLHQLERPEDQSILKYHMRSRSPSGERHHHSAHMYGKALTEPEPPASYTVNYKVSDYAYGNDEFGDYERGYMPQPFSVRPGYVPDKPAPRLLRSKSAGRYESGSPLPAEIVRSSTPGETRYRVQPSRIEDYAPGVSSLARYEHEVQNKQEDKDAVIVSKWIEERKQLSDQPQSQSHRQRSVPPRSGLFETHGYDRYFWDEDRDKTPTARRPLSPPRQDDVHKWYRSIQAGGEVPYGGLRQPAPERQDSFLRTAVHRISLNHKEVSTQACMSNDNSLPTINSMHDNHNGTNRWRRPPKPLPQRNLVSPILSKQRSSGKFAYERSKVSDFHLPTFRCSPEKSRSFGRQTPPPSRDPEFEEIDSYFAVLSRENKATSTGAKRKLNGYDGVQRYMDYQTREKSQLDQEYWSTLETLMAAIHDIDLITPDTAQSFNSLPVNNDAIPDVMQRSTSFPEGISAVGEVRKSVSFSTGPSSLCQQERQFSFSEVLDSLEQSSGQQKLTGRLQPAERSSLPHISEASSAAECMTRSQSASQLTSMLEQSSSLSDLSGSGRANKPPRPLRSILKARSASEQSLADLGRSSFAYRKLRGEHSHSSASSLCSSATPSPAKKSFSAVKCIVRRWSSAPALLPCHNFVRRRVDLSQRVLTQRLHGYHSYLIRTQTVTAANRTEMLTRFPRPLATPAFPPPRACPLRDSPIGYKPPADHYRPPKVTLDYGLDEASRFSRLEADAIIEQERRKRKEREAEDARSRRHGYAPLPSRSPGLTNDRFESLMTDYGMARQARATASPVGIEMRGVAKALYNFNGHNPRELTFKKGDLVRIRRMIDQNWYEGEFRGRIGIVPVNYVELSAVAKPELGLEVTDVEESREGQACATFSFDSRTMNELSLKKGEYVTITKKVDENWLEGRNSSGRVGIFPANYVQVLKDPSARHQNYSQDYGVDSAGRKTPRALGEVKAGDHALDIKAWELRQSAGRAPASGGARIPQGADTYRAVYAYRPRNPDELELRENDVVYVVEKCDDGWFIGTSLRTGQVGTFPGNYVTMY